MRYSNKIAHYLRSVRESKGYSQEFIAVSIGVSQSSYANLEAGKTSLSIDRLIQIMALLNIEWIDITNQLVNLNEKAGDGSIPIAVETHEPLYEMLIFELKSEISFLRQLIQDSTNQIVR